MSSLPNTIATAFKSINTLTHESITTDLKTDLDTIMEQLNTGKLRVASQKDGQWVTHEWIKQAILLRFKTTLNQRMPGFSTFYDKVPLKFSADSDEQLQRNGVRIVPPACVRFGAYIGPSTVLMPSYVNIGAYIDSGCMIDTWATVGSCAQIGKNVHLSGGAGIGGVLEPLNANPTIIEDNCFIGARSEIVEGVIVEKNAVISMGVFIGQSTPIFDVATSTISYGRVPEGAVVIPGTIPGKNAQYAKSAAIIVKQVDDKTRSKLTINELLRDHA